MRFRPLKSFGVALFALQLAASTGLCGVLCCVTTWARSAAAPQSPAEGEAGGHCTEHAPPVSGTPDANLTAREADGARAVTHLAHSQICLCQNRRVEPAAAELSQAKFRPPADDNSASPAILRWDSPVELREPRHGPGYFLQDHTLPGSSLHLSLRI